MKIKALTFFITGLFLSATSLTGYGQSYTFSGTMSNQVMHNYLDRAITMQTMCAVQGDTLTESQRVEQVAMLHNIGAKFIGRMASWWDGGWSDVDALQRIFKKCKKNVNDLKELDPEVICQAAVFEFVNPGVSSYDIPDYVFTAFGLPVQTRKFNHEAMLYPGPANQYHFHWGDMNETDRLTVPDITRLETQLWFYYLATQYIDAGCEAIHFGQAEMMNRRDIGNAAYWSFLMKVRSYAAGKNRGLVLCDAHTPRGGMYFQPGLTSTMSQASWQNYSPTFEANAQLIWDFHSFPLIYRKVYCTPTQQYVKLDKDPITSTHKGILTKSLGGVNPQGWYCDHSPLLNEYDNGGHAATVVGCANGTLYTLWGWDAISWFSQQPLVYRNDILKYTYYKVKCLDKDAHTQMPGLRDACPTFSSCFRYSALYYGQSGTIKDIWNNAYADESNWIHLNHTDAKIFELPTPVELSNSIAFNGDNMHYSITKAGYVRAFRKDIPFNAWTGTDPHLSAQTYYAQPISSQVKAKGPVIVSPDGNTIVYVGVDDYLHGFIVRGGYTYEYFDFPSTAGTYKVVNNAVVFASDSRIYYIGNEPAGQRIHGFIRSGSSWLTTSPTHASSPIYAPAMQEAAGGLTFDAAKDRIYFTGTDGFLYYHDIIDDWTYVYHEVSKVNMTAQGVRILANSKLAINGDRIYYIGSEPSGKRIHTLIDEPGGWNTFSPTHSAANYNGQPLGWQMQALGTEVAVSPDGNTIAYIGTDYKVYVYQNIGGGWIFAHNKTYEWDGNWATNSLQFKDNNTLYYISYMPPMPFNNWDYKIHVINFRESYCQNDHVLYLEPSFSYARTTAADSSGQLTPKEKNFSVNVKIYPNPASATLYISTTGSEHSLTYTITGMTGQLFEKGTLLANTTKHVNVSHLLSGFYIITIIDENGYVEREKISIMN